MKTQNIVIGAALAVALGSGAAAQQSRARPEARAVPSGGTSNRSA